MTIQEKISQAERRVLDALIMGKTNKEIALTLGSAEATVKMHIKNMCARFRVSNRTALAMATQGNMPATITQLQRTNERILAENERLRRELELKIAEARTLDRIVTALTGGNAPAQPAPSAQVYG